MLIACFLEAMPFQGIMPSVMNITFNSPTTMMIILSQLRGCWSSKMIGAWEFIFSGSFRFFFNKNLKEKEGIFAMIQLSNLTAQVLTPTGVAQALTFDKVIHKSCCSKNECFTRQLPTSVRLTGGCDAKYEVHFHGNISGAVGDVLQLYLALAGQPLPETEMRVIPANDPNSNNVNAVTYVELTCGDLDRLSVINGGTTNIAVAPNATLLVRRVA